jgi:H+-translocating NAD(P) transhydrogenase subunit alpha
MTSPLIFAAATEHAHRLVPLTSGEIFPLLFILVLAGFLGYEVIGRVSPTLHTPLMAATNAISGISLVGSLVAAGGPYSQTSHILGMVAVTAASINVVGGFLITDRMLRMFKKKDRGAKS